MHELGLMLWLGVIAGWVFANRQAVNKRPASLALPAALLALPYAASCGLAGDPAGRVMLAGVVFFVFSFAMLALTTSRRSVWGYALALFFGTVAVFGGVPVACSLLLGGE